MKKLLLLLFPVISLAQTVEWSSFPSVSLSYNPAMVGYCVDTDANGNVIWAGFKNEPYIYQDILGNQFFEKFDPEGNLLFSTEISGQAQTTDMGSDADGNIVLLLKFVGQMQIGDENFQTVQQGEQNVLVKFDADGNLLWHNWLQPEQMLDGFYNEIAELKALSVLADGSIVIGFSDFFKSVLRKYDASGNVLLEIEQENVRRISSVSVDSDGNFYTAGGCVEPNAKFAGIEVADPFTYETYIAKFNADGVFQWVKFAQDFTCSEARVIAINPDAVYFLTPVFGPLDFEGQLIEGSPWISDFLLAKFDASGAMQWVRETPGNGGFYFGTRNPVKADASGNIYLSGQGNGTIQWNESVATSTEGFWGQGICVRYNPDGFVTMAQTAEGNYVRFDNISFNDGKLSIAGMASGDLHVNGFWHTAVDTFDYYPFLLKVVPEVLSVAETTPEEILIYPNPCSGFIRGRGWEGSLEVSIVNMLGQEVLKTGWSAASELDVSGLPSGTYLIIPENKKPILFIKS